MQISTRIKLGSCCLDNLNQKREGIEVINNVDSTAYNVESTDYNIEITSYNIESTANKVKNTVQCQSTN